MAAIALVPLAALGALAIVSLFLVSPQGQKSSKETAEALSKLLNRLSEPEPEPEPKEPKPVPLPPGNLTEQCPRKQDRCPCCGEEPHSIAQKEGRSISEEEFYTPQRGMKNQPEFSKRAQELLKAIRSGPCKKILPDPGTPCGNYYVVSPLESQAARSTFQDYKRNVSSMKGKRIAHRVPLAAGGCPTGKGNLQEVAEECMPYEEELGELQGRAATYHRNSGNMGKPPGKRC